MHLAFIIPTLIKLFSGALERLPARNSEHAAWLVAHLIQHSDIPYSQQPLAIWSSSSAATPHLLVLALPSSC